MSYQKVIRRVVITQDAVSLIEKENKLTFMVDVDSKKDEIKRAVELLYEVEVDHVNTLNTPSGEKKAFVKLKPTHNASDLAVKLGIF